jgi:hypothetical protein
MAWMPALVIAATKAEGGAALWVAFAAPIIPVLVGYLLTRKKLRKQDARVEEIHILVNSRLSKTLDALSDALTENIRLKERVGEPVSATERRAAADRDSLPDLTAAIPPKEEK